MFIPAPTKFELLCPQTNDNFKMFFALINKDTEHIPSWNNLTAGEKKHASNIAPPLPVTACSHRPIGRSDESADHRSL